MFLRSAKRLWGGGALLIAGYAAALGGLLWLLHWLQSRLLVLHSSTELYAGAIALTFTGLGIWLARSLTTPKIEQVIVEKQVPVVTDLMPDPTAPLRYQISPRELEVLALMAEGLSNTEIAERLFVSLNTVKTHTSNLYAKLDAKRRTQAVEKAKRLKIIT